MADETFDAVIVGGGTKALFLAMYLIKYGGMSVGIFERRHEIGGCLATEETSAPGFAPPGKQVAQNEMQAPPAHAHSEAEWLEIKKRYTEDMLEVWRKYAPNMTEDNVIGIDSNSPYDCLRMKNLAPHGNCQTVDRSVFQQNENRPIPELANHRTPVKNLYATGAAWHPGPNGGCGESYNCYKIIAADLGLDNPWEELGGDETESLVAEVRRVIQRAQKSLEAKPRKH